MIPLAIATLWLAILFWWILIHMQVCGKRDWQTMRTCLRVHVRPCYEKWVEADDYHHEPYMRRTSMVWSEHTFINDDWTVKYER